MLLSHRLTQIAKENGEVPRDLYTLDAFEMSEILSRIVQLELAAANSMPFIGYEGDYTSFKLAIDEALGVDGHTVEDEHVRLGLQS